MSHQHIGITDQRRKTAWSWLRSLLWLDDEPGNQAPALRWKISVLRIILVGALLLCVAIVLRTFVGAYRAHVFSILYTVAGFYIALIVAIKFSARNPTLSGIFLLGMVYLAGFTMLFFVSDPALADLGLVFLYNVPQLAWIFFGIRCALWLMALNCIPFVLLLSGHRLLTPFGIDMLMPTTSGNFHTMLFVFFNVCIPLAFFRVLAAIKTSAQRQLETNARLQESNALYRDLFEHAGGPALICDSQGLILKANSLAENLLGQSLAQENQTTTLPDILIGSVPGCVPALLRNANEGLVESDLHLRDRDGDRKPVRVIIKPLGSNQSLLVGLRDLTPLRNIENELKEIRDARDRLIAYDHLTDLPNRDYLLARLQDLIDSGSDGAEQAVVAVASIRLNSVRSVNEKYGQATGDQLIREFGMLLLAQADSTVLPCRLHGLVFCLLIAGQRTPDELEQVIKTILHTISAPIEIGGNWVNVDTSVGVAFTQGNAISANELIRRSERALEAARKSTHDGFMLFNEELARETHRQIDIELALAHAIERDEFTLVYQPKVLANGGITGFEALLRWQSPELGNISPVEFIPIAERAGKIHAITRHVVDTACRQQRIWLDRHDRSLPVAINLSGIDLQREDISVTIADTAAKYRIDPALLHIEITETGLIENDDVARQNLEYLIHLGFHIAIDDFGTGYSSLKKLSEYPINTIKIDRSFVLGIGENPRSEQIIRLILTLANFLQCETVAEGVETAQQLDFLHKNGCERFQGYLFFRPLPTQDIDSLLSQ